jgi:hypothetical protein
LRMVGDEAGGFAFVESVEFLAVDGGHVGSGGEKIVGRRGKGKTGHGLRFAGLRLSVDYVPQLFAKPI